MYLFMCKGSVNCVNFKEKLVFSLSLHYLCIQLSILSYETITQLADTFRPIHHIDGAHFFASRADAYVLQGIYERDGATGHQLNIQSPWMPRWVSGYTTREIMLLEFSSSIMCLILAGKVGSNIASEIGTMRVTQQIDALDIMGVNSACYLILPKILGMVTIMPLLVIFSSAMGIIGAYGTAYIAHILPPDDLTLGLQHDFQPWFVWMSIIKSLFFAFIISAVPSYFGYNVEGGSVNVGKASTDAVVSSSVLILCSDVFLTQLLS